MSQNIQYTKYTINGKEFDSSSTTIDQIYHEARAALQPDFYNTVVHVTRTTFTENIKDGKSTLQKDARKRKFAVTHETTYSFHAWLLDYPKKGNCK